MANPSLGAGSRSDAEEARVASIAEGEITWTDIRDPTPTEMAMLERDYHFHSLDLDDCLSARQLTKVEDHGDHIFVALHFPDQVGKVIVSKQVSMFLAKDYIVTIHPSSFKPISVLFQSCRDDEKERSTLMKSSAYLAYKIIDRSVDGLFSILDNVETSLDSIEAVVFDEVKSSATAINAVRRQ